MRTKQQPNNLGKWKTRVSLKTKLSRRNVITITASVLFLIVCGMIIFINLSATKKTIASSTGDFRTAASGNWSSTSTWQRYNGSSWVAATWTPTSSDGAIQIQAAHTVTLTADVTADQLTIDGTLNINSSRYLYVANGTGTDLTVNGTITVTGYLTQNASSTITNAGIIQIASAGIEQVSAGSTITVAAGGTHINNGGTVPTASGTWTINGTYKHNVNGGTIPLATWNTGSNCLVTGITSSVPSNLNQSFSNFTWNCASQSSNISLGGSLTTVNGDFTVASTGSAQLQDNSGTSTLSIGGNYIQTGGTFVLSTTASITSTLNIAGDYTQSGGTFSAVTGNGSTANINVTGNWSHTGGTLTVGGNSSTSAVITFNKSGTQTFTSSGATVSGNVDYKVNSGSILVLGTNILAGRNFTLASGGGVTLGATAGITSSGATGNIQSSGTRSFSTGGDYTYNGTAAQNTGNGLPSTVHKLTISNSSNVTLTNTTAVSNSLAFTSGLLLTGANEMQVTATSASAIAGYSSTSYVIGNLRRTVTGTGTYDFPLGTSSNYELASLTLASTSGFTTVLGTFTNSNPLSTLLPLVNVVVSGLNINKMLDYGYWTLTPNSLLTGGTYTVNLSEKGQTNATGPSFNYCVLKRPNILSSWQSLGTAIPGGLAGGVATAACSALNSFSDFAIAYGEYLNFKNPVLISGVDGQVNAIYKFPNACTNIDVWIKLVSTSGGATLSSIDDFTTAGYDEAWQPFVTVAGNTTSSILWDLMFKVAGTSNDTTIPYITITGVDVDGNSTLREFVEATWPHSYSYDPATTLTITNTGTAYRALGGTTDLTGIDTSRYQAMFQINYQNISSFQYRTGAVSTQSAAVTRQNSLYFKSFFPGTGTLPIKLLYFKGALNKSGKVDLTWATSTEINNDNFIVERSSDGSNFEEVFRKKGAGNSTSTIYYTGTDEQPLPGDSYYRLKQTDFDGHVTYSEVVSINNKSLTEESILNITSVSPNPFEEKFTASFRMTSAKQVNFQLVNSSGQPVFSDVINATEGMNQYDFIDKQNLLPGIYFMVMTCDDQKISQKIIKK